MMSPKKVTVVVAEVASKPANCDDPNLRSQPSLSDKPIIHISVSHDDITEQQSQPNSPAAAAAATVPPVHTLALPEYFIPQLERKYLLRKFSAPLLERSQHCGDGKQLSLLARSPSLDEFTVRRNGFVGTPNPMSVVHSKHFLDDKLKCPMCMNPFRDPRVLDCLHSFCFHCLCVADMVVRPTTSTTRPRENSELSWSGTAKSLESVIPQSFSVASSIDIDHRVSVGRSGARKTFDQKHNKERKNSLKPMGAKGRQSSAVSFTESTKTTIRCQVCATATEIPVGGLQRLPPNFMLVRRIKLALAQLGQQLNPTTGVLCSLCFSETHAVACCLICNQNLCELCRDAHVRQKSTSMHDVRYLNDLQSQSRADAGRASVDGGNAKKVLKCAVHPTHDLKLFCTSCYQVACSNCTIILHRGHKCEPIQKAAKTYVKMVRSALERTRPMPDFANDAISRLHSYAKRLSQRAETITNDVDVFMQAYQDALQAHWRTLHKQIGRARETKQLAISEQQTQLLQRSTDAKVAIQFADELLMADDHDGGNVTEALTFVGILLRRFDHCQRSGGVSSGKVGGATTAGQSVDSLTFLPGVQAPTTAEQHNIPMYGIITTQTAIPKFCTIAEADGLQFLRVHRKVELRMTARDCDDRTLCHGGLRPDVRLKYRDATARLVPVTVGDSRDGTYVITFVPDAAGAMVMSVTVQDKHIKGSPFNLCARTLRPHSGHFHCCAFCSSKGSKTAVCACSSIMPGGYKGCGHGHDGHPGRRHWSCCASDLESSECSATNAFR